MPSKVRILPSPLFQFMVCGSRFTVHGKTFAWVGGNHQPWAMNYELGSKRAGVTQLVESQPSKLLVAGSSPVSRFFSIDNWSYADVLCLCFKKFGWREAVYRTDFESGETINLTQRRTNQINEEEISSEISSYWKLQDSWRSDKERNVS